jgi:hypothetical protein
MKKKLWARCLLGAPIGLAISTAITIVISLTVGDGRFYPCVPELVQEMGSEIGAVSLQALCSLLYGAAWGGASVIWDMERWSLLRQTLTHLVVCSAATFPIAYLMRWMPHSAWGAMAYFGIFAVIYAVIWLWQYAGMKRRIGEINARVGRK